MKMFISKDQLTHFLIKGDIHLSKKDYGFFNNLKTQISNSKPITSNQDKLYSKLLLKYKRQFVKLGYDVEQLNGLGWQIEIVPSKEEFCHPKISFENGEIKIRCPYNTKFIQKFKNVQDNFFIWDKQNKCYSATASTHNLKIAYSELNKYFENVNYDSTVESILLNLQQYKSFKLWDPTLVKTNNNFYIYGINESLNKALHDIKLSDEPQVLLKLSQYGVKIDQSILQDDDLLHFASNFYPCVDIDDIKSLGSWLKELNYDLIYLGSEIIFNKEISKDIRDVLSEIPISRNTSDLDLYENILYLNYTSYKHSRRTLLLHNENLHKNISKVVTIKNSRPILVK
jgi:hypothetical protein